MILSTKGSVVRLVIWQWRHVTLSFCLASVVVVAHELMGWSWLQLPAFPLAIVGAALGIFVSFRTNSCYDRWWEGRKLWGRMVNTSRHIAIETLRYLPDEKEEAKQRIIRRHIAYVHTLRALLRQQDALADDDVNKYLGPEEVEEFRGSSNLTARLLDRQMDELTALHRDGAIDSFQLQSFDESIRHLFDIQGGCERIKKTPLPRPYGFISERMIQWFGALLPLGLVPQLGWAAIPVSVLVTLGFKLISETGRVLEDPFNMFWNALPLSFISRMIEINILEISGEKDLPPPIEANAQQILM